MIRKTSSSKASRESNFSSDVEQVRPDRAFVRDPFSRTRVDRSGDRANAFLGALGLLKEAKGALEDPNAVTKAKADALKGNPRPESNGLINYFTNGDKAVKAYDQVDAHMQSQRLDADVKRFINENPQLSPEELQSGITQMVQDVRQYSSGISDDHFLITAESGDKLLNHYNLELGKIKQKENYDRSRNKIYDSSVTSFKNTLETRLGGSLDKISTDPQMRDKFYEFITSSEGLKYKTSLRNMFAQNSKLAKQMGVNRKDYTNMMVDYVTNEAVGKGMPELLEVLSKKDKDGISMIDALGPEGKEAFQQNMIKARSKKFQLDELAENLDKKNKLESIKNYTNNLNTEFIDDFRTLATFTKENTDDTGRIATEQSRLLERIDQKQNEMLQDPMWKGNEGLRNAEIGRLDELKKAIYQTPNPEVSERFIKMAMTGQEIDREDFANNFGLLDDKARNLVASQLSKQDTAQGKVEASKKKLYFQSLGKDYATVKSLATPQGKFGIIMPAQQEFANSIAPYKDLGFADASAEIMETMEKEGDLSWGQQKEIYEKHRDKAWKEINRLKEQQTKEDEEINEQLEGFIKEAEEDKTTLMQKDEFRKLWSQLDQAGRGALAQKLQLSDDDLNELIKPKKKWSATRAGRKALFDWDAWDALLFPNQFNTEEENQAIEDAGEMFDQGL